MPTILLARHGQASFGGADYDVLSERGHEQAAALTADLARRRVRIDRVVSGALVRQRDTAAPVAAHAGVEVSIDPRWNEYDANDVLASHSTSPVRDSRPPGSDAPEVSSAEFQDIIEQALAAWMAAGDGGGAAETWPAFAARVAAALDDVATALAPGETALVCTSGGVIAAACVALLDIPAHALLELNRVSVNTAVTKVVHGRRGTTLVTFNEHAHLDGALLTYR